MERPGPSEAAPYYFRYIDLVPTGDVVSLLEAQGGEALALFGAVSEERSRHRYAPDKWSIRQVLSHLNDAERVFASRALWFARGFESPLPSFDQDTSAAAAGADERTWASHVDEFQAVRAATLALFRSLPPGAWARSGVASGTPVTVKALAY